MMKEKYKLLEWMLNSNYFEIRKRKNKLILFGFGKGRNLSPLFPPAVSLNTRCHFINDDDAVF